MNQSEVRSDDWLVTHRDVLTQRDRQNGHDFADDFFFLNQFLKKNCSTLIPTSLKLLSQCPINNNAPLVKMIAWRWRRMGENPLSEPMLVELRKYGSLGINETKRRIYKSTVPSVDQVMVCNLFSTKLSPESNPVYFHLETNQISIRSGQFRSRKYIWNYHLQNVSHFL